MEIYSIFIIIGLLVMLLIKLGALQEEVAKVHRSDREAWRKLYYKRESANTALQTTKLVQWFAENDKDIIDSDGYYKEYEYLTQDVRFVIDGMFYITPFEWNGAVKALNLPAVEVSYG